MPPLQHVFVVVLENQDYSAVIGSSAAPYLNSLANQNALLTNYFGVGHVSLTNYIGMTDGELPDADTKTDCIAKYCVRPQRNVADQLDEHGLTWTAYMESMTLPCQHPPLAGAPDPFQSPYATRHNPFVYYDNIVNNPNGRCAAHDIPYDAASFQSMLATNSGVPNFSFIVPNNCHNDHDPVCFEPPGAPEAGGLPQSDKWSTANLPAIVDYVNDPQQRVVRHVRRGLEHRHARLCGLRTRGRRRRPCRHHRRPGPTSAKAARSRPVTTTTRCCAPSKTPSASANTWVRPARPAPWPSPPRSTEERRSMPLNRRDFLKGAAGVGGAFALGQQAAHAGLLVPAPRVALSSSSLPDAGSRLIEHVVVIMMENRSTDHLLGWHPNADVRQAQSFVDNAGVSHGTYDLLDTHTYMGCGKADRTNHNYDGGRLQINGGAWTGS